MSFIRQTQEGFYVTIPGGSNYYIYDNGTDIEGWSRAEFAALIGGVVNELPDEAFASQTREEIQGAFTAHFGGWDAEYRGGITPPERAEIFCQCVDRRIDDVELTGTLHSLVKQWADEFDALRTCTYCGTEFHPVLYNENTDYVCSSEACKMAKDAELYGLSLEDARRAEMISTEIGFDEEWNYISAHSKRDDL